MARARIRTAALVIAAASVSGCRSAAPPEEPGAKQASNATDASGGAQPVAPLPEAAPPRAPTATTPAALPDVATDWCLEGWRGLDEETCYFLPEGEPPRRLLIYLSGIVPPTPRSLQKEKVQRVVAAAARRTGAAALLPRGRRGIGPSGAKDWWAWPTSESAYATYAAAMVERWKGARSKLESALGRRFERTYLAGSSSGAYFLAALALAGSIDVDAYAATSGGAASFAASHDAGGPPKPFYVGYASGDPNKSAPKGLGAFLASKGWPVLVREHPGGHGAREEYLDEAFAFWESFERDGGM
jgi:predicted esterase